MNILEFEKIEKDEKINKIGEICIKKYFKDIKNYEILIAFYKYNEIKKNNKYIIFIKIDNKIIKKFEISYKNEIKIKEKDKNNIWGNLKLWEEKSEMIITGNENQSKNIALIFYLDKTNENEITLIGNNFVNNCYILINNKNKIKINKYYNNNIISFLVSEKIETIKYLSSKSNSIEYHV